MKIRTEFVIEEYVEHIREQIHILDKIGQQKAEYRARATRISQPTVIEGAKDTGEFGQPTEYVDEHAENDHSICFALDRLLFPLLEIKFLQLCVVHHVVRPMLLSVERFLLEIGFDDVN